MGERARSPRQRPGAGRLHARLASRNSEGDSPPGRLVYAIEGQGIPGYSDATGWRPGDILSRAGPTKPLIACRRRL